MHYEHSFPRHLAGSMLLHLNAVIILRMNNTPPSQASYSSLSPHQTHLVDRAQQLRFKNVFSLLVLLARLIRLVVLPPHRLLALPARNIPHNVSSGRHIALCGFCLCDIDDGAEEVGFAVLAAEILVESGD